MNCENETKNYQKHTQIPYKEKEEKKIFKTYIHLYIYIYICFNIKSTFPCTYSLFAFIKQKQFSFYQNFDW